jgi:hypothetical protein
VFVAGGRYGGVIEGGQVELAAAREGGRHVLRVILPDGQGNLGRDMAEPHNLRYEGGLH